MFNKEGREKIMKQNEPKDVVKNEVGTNSFTLSPTKWVKYNMAISQIE